MQLVTAASVPVASTDDTRPHLAGALFEGEARTVRMVTTDGHRLSKAERIVAASDYDGHKQRCIVHRRGAAELQRILEGSDPSVRVEFSGRNVIFSSDKARLQIRQIEESFPDYARVIPDRGDTAVTLATGGLASSIRRVKALGAAKDPLLRLRDEIHHEAPAESVTALRRTVKVLPWPGRLSMAS